MNLEEFSRVNADRCDRWHEGWRNGDHSWTGADWGNAMAGEAGEACNVVKKLRRGEVGFKGQRDPERDVLLGRLADELGDLVAYADLLATYYGLDLATCVRQKFNRVSEREGFPERVMPQPEEVSEEEVSEMADDKMAEAYAVVRVRIADELGRDVAEVTPDALLIEDLNADSLDLVELIMALEDEVGRGVSDEMAERVYTVEDCCRLYLLSVHNVPWPK